MLLVYVIKQIASSQMDGDSSLDPKMVPPNKLNCCQETLEV